MKKWYFWTCMLLWPAFLLAGCEDGGKEEPGGEGKVDLPNASEKIQTAFADEETTGRFTFTATADWTISVKEHNAALSAPLPNAAGASWLRLLRNGVEAYRGAAGTYTLDVALEPNYTGAERSATITIACGSDKATITVTQSGKTQGGEVPVDPDPDPEPSRQYERYVARIEYVDGGVADEVYSFSYDTRQRVERITMDNYREGEGLVSDETYTFGYINKNTMRIVAGSQDTGSETAVVTLNPDGSIASFRVEGDSAENTTYTYENGYLARTESDYGYRETMTWQDGNLVTYTYYDKDLPFSESYAYTSYPDNPKVNVNFNAMFCCEFDMFSLLDLTGKRSRQYVATGRPWNERVYSVYDDGQISIVTKVYYDPLAYTFDTQGCVETITLTWTEKQTKTVYATGATEVLSEKTDEVSWRITYVE